MTSHIIDDGRTDVDAYGKTWLVRVLVFEVVVVAILLFLGARAHDPRLHFDEGQVGTFLSAAHLLAVAIISWKIPRASGRDGSFRRFSTSGALWRLIAIGCVFLVVDEIVGLHESFDRKLHRGLGMEQTGWTDRIDDLIAGLYAVAAIVLLYSCRRELNRFRAAVRYLVGGFLLGFVMIGLDALTNRPDVLRSLLDDQELAWDLFVWLGAIEDGFKLLAEGVGLVAFLVALRIAQSSSVPMTVNPREA